MISIRPFCVKSLPCTPEAFGGGSLNLVCAVGWTVRELV